MATVLAVLAWQGRYRVAQVSAPAGTALGSLPYAVQEQDGCGGWLTLTGYATQARAVAAMRGMVLASAADGE